MINIKLVNVTYRQPENLERLYDSLASSFPVSDDNFIIINNHSHFRFNGRGTILHNTIRPDWSLGYLARSWNQGLLWAFHSSAAPKCEWVGLLQGDIVLEEGWYDTLRSLADQGRQFVACAPGDQAIFLSLDAFRTLGWWDERFSGIGYQEFDYFLRAFLRLGRRAEIEGHGRSLRWNWSGAALIKQQMEDRSGHSTRLNPMLLGHLIRKWSMQAVEHLEFFGGNAAQLENWVPYFEERFGDEPSRAAGHYKIEMPKEHNWYPHFYIDDERDYSHLYYDYVNVTSQR